MCLCVYIEEIYKNETDRASACSFDDTPFVSPFNRPPSELIPTDNLKWNFITMNFDAAINDFKSHMM